MGQKVYEGSFSQVKVRFLDSSNTLFTPSSARYRVDSLGTGRQYPQAIADWTAIATPASTETITITAAQNKIFNTNNRKEVIQVTVEGTDPATGETVKAPVEYDVWNLYGTP